MKRVLGSIRRADERYHMIEDGDRICIGVSGGKDSLLLMEALKLYQNFSRTKFEVCAVSLDLGIVEQDWESIKAFAARIGIDYTVLKTDIGEVVFHIRQEKNPCALCAKLRRGALNNAARDRGCNKVALGHNREDVLETFLMSMLYEGRINTFGPLTYLSRADVVSLYRGFSALGAGCGSENHYHGQKQCSNSLGPSFLHVCSPFFVLLERLTSRTNRGRPCSGFRPAVPCSYHSPR